MIKETKKRSIVKAISYRFLATSTTFLLALVFTGSIEIATSISILDFVFKLGIYFFNERLWNLTSWGYLKSENISKKTNNYAAESSPVETA